MKIVASAPIPEVPSDWEVITLSEVCRVENGCPFESMYFNERAGLPLVRVRDVNAGVSKTLYSGPYEDRYLVANGDLLVGMDGEFHVRTWSAGRALLNQRVCRLVPNIKRLDKDFLGYAIRAPLSHIEAHTPYTTVKHISAHQILAIPLPYPPLGEQRQIAAVLSAAQRAIEQQERLIALTAELKKALMHKLFTEGTRGEPLKQTAIGAVPRSWSVEPLGQLFSREPSNGLYRPQSDYGRGVLILRIDDFKSEGDIVTSAKNRVEADETDCQRFGLAKDDIVLNRVNSLSHLGKTALIGDLAEPMLFESNMMRFRVDEKRLRSAFAFRALNSSASKSQIIGRAKRAVAQSSVNQGDVARVLIPLPPDLEAQDEILTLLNALETKSAVHTQTRISLTNLFSTLLHQLMTAQIRAHDLDLSALHGTAQPVGGA